MKIFFLDPQLFCVSHKIRTKSIHFCKYKWTVRGTGWQTARTQVVSHLSVVALLLQLMKRFRYFFRQDRTSCYELCLLQTPAQPLHWSSSLLLMYFLPWSFSFQEDDSGISRRGKKLRQKSSDLFRTAEEMTMTVLLEIKHTSLFLVPDMEHEVPVLNQFCTWPGNRRGSRRWRAVMWAGVTTMLQWKHLSTQGWCCIFLFYFYFAS